MSIASDKNLNQHIIILLVWYYDVQDTYKVYIIIEQIIIHWGARK